MAAFQPIPAALGLNSWVGPAPPWLPKPCEILTTRRPRSTPAESLLSTIKEPEAKLGAVLVGEIFSGLSISTRRESATFERFPELPAEIRLQIWSHAILSLPERIIPIREVTGRKRTPAYFTSSRPHSIFASLSREARGAVFSTLQRLFLPGGRHDFVSFNMEKDVVLLCPDNGHLRPKTLKRLQKAMGLKNREDHLHLAAQVQIEQRGNYFIPQPEWDVIASLTEIFPEICHITLVPLQCVHTDGADNYLGEFYLGDEEGFEGRIKDYYTYVNNEEYQRKRGYFRAWDAQAGRVVFKPEGVEIRWGCLKLVGGKNVEEGTKRI